MAKVAFNNKRTLFTTKIDLECGAEIWTLRAVDHKHLESFEMWCWRRMEKIS
jgi:hypothetical protein